MRAKIQLYENILEIGVYYLHCALRNLDILSEMSWNGKCLSHVELPKQLLLLIYLNFKNLQMVVLASENTIFQK